MCCHCCICCIVAPPLFACHSSTLVCTCPLFAHLSPTFHPPSFMPTHPHLYSPIPLTFASPAHFHSHSPTLAPSLVLILLACPLNCVHQLTLVLVCASPLLFACTCPLFVCPHSSMHTLAFMLVHSCSFAPDQLYWFPLTLIFPLLVLVYTCLGSPASHLSEYHIHN